MCNYAEQFFWQCVAILNKYFTGCVGGLMHLGRCQSQGVQGWCCRNVETWLDNSV